MDKIITGLKNINADTHTEEKREHVENVVRIIFEELDAPARLRLDEGYLRVSALAHDVAKGLKDSNASIHIFRDTGDVKEYVRKNLDILDPYGLAYYFNTDIDYHALAGGIWLEKTYDIKDPRILYPIFFHTCPAVDVYKTLDEETRLYCDVLALADKMEKNDRKLKKNIEKNKKQKRYSKYDLNHILFGASGKEFNMTAALFMIRHLEFKDEESGNEARKAYRYFYDELRKISPFLPEEYPFYSNV
jgi:HD superfamily phosphohydrolase YqeK